MGQQLQAEGRALPGRAIADADFEDQVRRLEADPAPKVVCFGIGVVVAVSWGRVACAGVAAGAVFGRAAQGEAVGIAAGDCAEGVPAGQAGRGPIRLQRGQGGIGVFLFSGEAADEDELEALACGRLVSAVQQGRDLAFGPGDAAGIEVPEAGCLCKEGFDLLVERHGTPVVGGQWLVLLLAGPHFL